MRPGKQVRIREEVFVRLQRVATHLRMAFSSPNDVIERVVDFWEKEHCEQCGRENGNHTLSCSRAQFPGDN